MNRVFRTVHRILRSVGKKVREELQLVRGNGRLAPTHRRFTRSVLQQQKRRRRRGKRRRGRRRDRLHQRSLRNHTRHVLRGHLHRPTVDGRRCDGDLRHRDEHLLTLHVTSLSQTCLTARSTRKVKGEETPLVVRRIDLQSHLLTVPTFTASSNASFSSVVHSPCASTDGGR